MNLNEIRRFVPGSIRRVHSHNPSYDRRPNVRHAERDLSDIEAIESISEKHRGPDHDTKTPLTTAVVERSPTVEPPKNDSGNQFASFAADEAPIWSDYLEAAMKYDTRLVQQWNSDLDSLLIFAGLFSAILSAFLIESRKALHEDPQDLTNLLLTTVTQELRNATPASTCTNCFRPETFQIAVNYLWFLGLTFSVGSAFLAVLAKGWVSLYNVSPDNQHWSHAHSRQLRYNNMVVWKLVTVISCIPLFLHISVFFFFAGLVTLLIYDSYEIAYSNLAIIFIMTMFYVFMTILPVLFPGCPFKTPFSVQMFPARAVTPGKHTTFWGFISYFQLLLLPAIFALRVILSVLPRLIVSRLQEILLAKEAFLVLSYSHVVQVIANFFHPLGEAVVILWASRQTPSGNDPKVDALTWLLSVSKKQLIIQNAAKALAGTPFSTHLRETPFNHGACINLAQQLSNYIKRPLDAVQREDEEHINAFLLALLHVIQRTHSWNHPNLPHLAALVASQGPLHQWDDLPPRLRIIGYCVQTCIKSLCNIVYDPWGDYQKINILLEAGIQQYHWQALARTVALRIDRGGKSEKAQGVKFLEQLARHSSGIAHWVQGPLPNFHQLLVDAGIEKSLYSMLYADSMMENHHKDFIHRGIAALQHNSHPHMTQVRVFVALVQFDAIRPVLIKEKTFGWLLSTLEYKKKSPPGLADLLSRIVKHDDVCDGLLTKEVLQSLLDCVQGKKPDHHYAAMHIFLGLCSNDVLRSTLIQENMPSKIILQIFESNGDLRTVWKQLIKFDDILAKLIESGIVSALAKKIQHPSQKIREFWLDICSDLARREDCLAQLQSVFSHLISLIQVDGKIDRFESGYGGMIEILGCFEKFQDELHKNDQILNLIQKLKDNILQALQHSNHNTIWNSTRALSGLAHNSMLLSRILDADFLQILSGALLNRSLHPDMALNLGRLWQKLMIFQDTATSLTKTDVMSHWHLINTSGSSIGSFEKCCFNMLSATLKHDYARKHLIEDSQFSQILRYLMNASSTKLQVHNQAELLYELATHGDGFSQFEKAGIISQLFKHLKTRGFHWGNSIKIFNLLTFIKHDKICLEFDKDAIQELLSVLKTCDTGIQAHAAELLVKLKPQAVKWNSGSTAETVMDIIQEDLFPLPIRRTEDNFKPWMARAKGISTLVRHGLLQRGDSMLVGEIVLHLGSIKLYGTGDRPCVWSLYYSSFLNDHRRVPTAFLIEGFLKLVTRPHPAITQPIITNNPFIKELIGRPVERLRAGDALALLELVRCDGVRIDRTKILNMQYNLAKGTLHSDRMRQSFLVLTEHFRDELDIQQLVQLVKSGTCPFSAIMLSKLVKYSDTRVELEIRQADVVSWLAKNDIPWSSSVLWLTLVARGSESDAIRLEFSSKNIASTLVDKLEQLEVHECDKQHRVVSALSTLARHGYCDALANADKIIPSIEKLLKMRPHSKDSNSKAIYSLLSVLVTRTQTNSNINVDVKPLAINISLEVIKKNPVDGNGSGGIYLVISALAKCADTCAKLFNGGIVAWIVRIIPTAEGSALKVMLLALAMDDENQALDSRDAHLLRKAIIPGLVQKFQARPRRPSDHYYIGDILSKLAQHGDVRRALLKEDILLIILATREGSPKSDLTSGAQQLLVNLALYDEFAYLISKRQIASKLLGDLHESRLGWARNISKILSALVIDHPVVDRPNSTNRIADTILDELSKANLVSVILNLLERNILSDDLHHSHFNWVEHIGETLSVFAPHDHIRARLIKEGLISILLTSLKRNSHDIRSSCTRLLASLVCYDDIRASLPTMDLVMYFFELSFRDECRPAMIHLMYEFMMHDDTRPVVLKLDAAKTIFGFQRDVMDAVKELDMIGVIDKTSMSSSSKSWSQLRQQALAE